MDLGPAELLVVVAVAVLLFGSRKIPELAHSLGRAIREFREGVAEGRGEGAPPSDAPGPDSV
ncbi:MAG TPA: twin-arginine translocase TatA/TatE family subunit [Actinomycetota bacterium]|jgi:sec-independent protein translocase protein TatA|nr:twin-arginine translocase TatA/TatE family subunit [Actinomycetota bacterium]